MGEDWQQVIWLGAMIVFNGLRTLWQEIINFLLNYLLINQYCQNQQIYTEKGPKIVPDDQLKILLLTPYSPVPAYSGGAIRRMEQIRFLGCRYPLAIVSFIHSDSEYDLLAKLQEFCFLAIPIRRRELKIPFVSKKSDLIAKFASWKMRIVLRRLRSLKFDIVLIDSIFMAQYALLFSDSYRILLEQNIESTILVRTLALSELFADADQISDKRSEIRLLQEYENKTWSEFLLRAVVSEIDKQELDSRCSVGKTIVVKNGVDTQAMAPGTHSSNSKKILFMGILSYEANIDAIAYFIKDILPLIWQIAADVKFCIAGANPTLEVYSLANDARIEIIANPEDMNQVALSCILTVVPLRLGSGTRIKILQAMAMGLPVVSTSLGAEGLEVVDNQHLSICDQPQQFAAAVVRLTSDLSFRRHLQSNARQLVEERYDWHKIWNEFEQEMLAAVGKNQPDRA